MSNLEIKDYDELKDELLSMLENKSMKPFRAELEDMNEFDVARFLSELPRRKLAMVFRLLSKSKAADVFANLDVEEQTLIIECITDTELSEIIEELYVDDAVDMLEELPANVVKRVMRTATSETRNLINQFLKYPENSAGSIMTAEYVDLKKYMNVREAFARIRRIGEDKETIYTCFVISSDQKLEGVVTVRDLLLSEEDALIGDIMDENVIRATTTDDQEEVSGLCSDYDLLTIPIVDLEDRLVGIVTVDDVLDVIQQEATEDIEIMAAISPSDKPYIKLSVFEIFKNRMPWLLLLMISATFTGAILGSFEDKLASQAVLIAFIPMLMDTGGNSGGQSSVTVIRALSLGDIEFRDFFRILWKEFRVALLCGAALAIANFAKVLLFDRLIMGNMAITMPVAAVVCLTLFLTVLCAKLVGCSLPLLAEKIGFDPAVMASPFITTIVDAISLIVYFMIASAILK
ncbi:MAG: magnesium transporter, partial [Oscillospiraceae bacterium]